MTAPPSRPRQFQDIAYTRFRRALLKTKGSDKQKDFLERRQRHRQLCHTDEWNRNRRR